ncbi:MAG: metal ABC transporter permease [Demequinaceae bacterium]|nr:metal ABC transporter permease [Demequinaceae bacterium]
MDLLSDPLMQRALLVALLVGLTSPVIGTYLVQRRMALLGDGIGHVALAGVAAGWLAGSAANLAQRDALALPGAVLFAIAAAVTIERLREKGTSPADVAMAILFYGGIALGVLLIGLAGGTSSNLLGYLFGSISTVTWPDVWLSVGLSCLILAIGLGLRHSLFAVTHDQDFAVSSGLPVRLLNLVVAVLAAVTITVAMRVVGVLLVSGLMILPVAIAQQISRSFARTMTLAMGLGAVLCVTGLTITYYHDLQPGALIIVLGVAAFAVTASIRGILTRRANQASLEAIHG